MIARELINHSIPTLKKEDKSVSALDWMQEFHLSMLPVVVKGVFCGFLNEQMILSHPEIVHVKDFELSGEKSVVQENQHYYDLFKCLKQFANQMVAVNDETNNYLGVVTNQELLAHLVTTLALSSPGAIIVLSLNNRDYSLSEISRIIERDDGKILSCEIASDPQNNGNVLLTIKVNKEDISNLISILELNGYNIQEYFSQHFNDSNTKERYEGLMSFLNI